MFPGILRRALLVLAAAGFLAVQAQAAPSVLGVIVMHGKGGSPARNVSALASALQDKGYLVANLEMPWSGRRQYDVGVAAAEAEVDAAIDALRAKGATHVFVAGHSQGGVFALYLGGRAKIDGVVAIAPGGSSANPVFVDKLGESMAQARKLVAEGRGGEKNRFMDFEGSKGTFPVVCSAAAYVSWFDPQGAMNQMSAMKNIRVPVLYVAPTDDYPGLRAIRQRMYGALPADPLTALYEPQASHLGAPSAAIDEIVRWTAKVAAAR